MTPGLVGTAACEPIKTATPQYLTAEQVGELLQVSPRTVQRWALEDASMPTSASAEPSGSRVRSLSDGSLAAHKDHARARRSRLSRRRLGSSRREHLMVDQLH